MSNAFSSVIVGESLPSSLLGGVVEDGGALSVHLQLSFGIVRYGAG
jgi:hypothetical protein